MNRMQNPSRYRAVAASILLSLTLFGCSGDNPETMLASARDYMAKGDLKAAVIQVKNALQENPELAEARYLLGVALLRGGDPVGAETELRKAVALQYPDDKTAPVLAQALLAQGQYKKVIDELAGKNLSEAAARADLLTSLATAYQVTRSPDKAKEAMDGALAAVPGYAPAQLFAARRQAAGGDIDGALTAVDAIVAKTPGDHEALKLKGDLLAARNRFDDAVAAYRKAVEAKPDFLTARVALLTVLMSQSSIDEAAKELEPLKKQAPNSPTTRYFETQLAYQKKDFKAAKDLVLQLLKVAPDHPQAQLLAGAIELQVGTTLQAETYLSKVLATTPNSPLARRLLATAYMRSGQGEKALATLQPLLKDAESDPSLSALAGQAYLQAGDAKKAEEYFAKSAKQDHKNTRTRTALALTHLAGGGDTGLGELRSIAESDTGTTADLALISVHLRRNEYDQALKAIDALEKKQPDKPLAANLRGRTLLAKRDMAGARKAFERSLQLDPNYFAAIASLAAIDLAEKKPDAARKRFDDVLAKNPKHPQALLALAELRAREGGKKEEVVELINRAVTANPTEKAPRLLLVELYLRTKDVKQALSTAQSAASTLPDSPEVQDALGRAQLAAGDTNQALATFTKVASLQPGSPLPQMRLAEVNMIAKNKSAAVQSLKRALEIKPDHLDAQRGLILMALDAKNFTEANAVARTVQKQRPKESVGYQFEGDIAAMQKKYDPAAEAYRAGLKQGAFPELATKLYATLKVSGKTADADRMAATWLRDHPKEPVMRMYMAGEAIAAKDFSAGEKLYLSVLQLQPNNAIAYNNLAWVTGQLKKDGAIAYAEKAIALVPNQPAYMDTLAMLLLDKNDVAKALEWQNKAVALQPSNGLYKLNLARIHIKGGNKEQARKELDELAKLGDKFAGQAQVAELRKSL